jgi:hypothetical protein
MFLKLLIIVLSIVISLQSQNLYDESNSKDSLMNGVNNEILLKFELQTLKKMITSADSLEKINILNRVEQNKNKVIALRDSVYESYKILKNKYPLSTSFIEDEKYLTRLKEKYRVIGISQVLFGCLTTTFTFIDANSTEKLRLKNTEYKIERQWTKTHTNMLLLSLSNIFSGIILSRLSR